MFPKMGHSSQRSTLLLNQRVFYDLRQPHNRMIDQRCHRTSHKWSYHKHDRVDVLPHLFCAIGTVHVILSNEQWNSQGSLWYSRKPSVLPDLPNVNGSSSHTMG
jgi:hypothetical protein